MSKYVLEKCPLECNQNQNCIFFNGCKRYKDYRQGRADGYSQAEKDYFAQSQKDREDTYNCGYTIGRADAIDEFKNIILDKGSKIEEDYDYVPYARIMIWENDFEKIVEQLKESK